MQKMTAGTAASRPTTGRQGRAPRPSRARVVQESVGVIGARPEHREKVAHAYYTAA